MVFSSATFIFMFLPIVIFLYYLVPNRFKNILLLIASLYFYAFGEKVLVIMIVLSTIVNYYLGILIEDGKEKLGMRLSLAFNLLTLGFFKYFNFTFDNFNALLIECNIQSEALSNLPKIALPIGISFYTFECLSYTIDVYRKDVKANRNYIEFATFVTLFPQLVAGPIVRYIDVQQQLAHKSVFNLTNFTVGLERFIVGLAKKMIIANTFASVADQVFNRELSELSTFTVWVGIISYSIQIYYDFSAYSDMAIGLGKMFGFEFLENFNYPYIAKSIQDFWRRWHISLSTWFRDYVYIPLGGNRLGNRRTYFNLFLVFFVTGLWHGASWNFIVWGVFHGMFLIIERLGFDKILTKCWTPIQHCYTLFVVLIGWIFFRAENLTYAMGFIQKMFSINYNEPVTSYISLLYVSNEWYIMFIFALLFATPIYQTIYTKLSQSYFIYIKPLVFITLLLVCLSYIAADSYNPFIYFKF